MDKLFTIKAFGDKASLDEKSLLSKWTVNCVSDCKDNFNSKSLSANERVCVENCAYKYLENYSLDLISFEKVNASEAMAKLK